MPSKFDDFETQVIIPIQITPPHNNNVYGYAQYLALSKNERDGDEANAVDDRFSKLLIGWLGYGAASYTYNQHANTSDRPDYVVRKNSGAMAFIIEDKATPIDFDPVKHADQLRRYTAGTAGYAIWTNARRILGVRFDPQGNYNVLVDVRVAEAFGPQPSLLPTQLENDVEQLYQLFNSGRYNDIDAKILSITTDPLTNQPITEQAWQQQARAVNDNAALRTFVSDSGNVLDALKIAVRARLDAALRQIGEVAALHQRTQDDYRTSTQQLIADLQSRTSTMSKLPPNTLPTLQQKLAPLEYQVEKITADLLAQFEPANLPSDARYIWMQWRTANVARAIELHASSFANPAEQRITDAFKVWTEKYRIIEDTAGSDDEREANRRKAYSEQVAYVFFVRLLLARILEDKGIMNRLISDGGFASWHNFLDQHFYQSALGVHGIDNELFPVQLVTMLFKGISRYYRHFYNQPVFDWFEPDDYLLAIALEHLNGYNFDNISSDIIGFTYENFIDRTARNRKGHFLTRPQVVDYMLDQAGYNGVEIIGYNLIDPACGSGSFLVHAARRLRAAYGQSHASASPGTRQRNIAKDFIAAVQQSLYGMDINPFSCYLAELNLFIQVLDDLIYLWQHNEPINLDTFKIYNANSLELPREILAANPQQLPTPPSNEEQEREDLLLGEGAHVKRMAGQFKYVIANPPYVNRGIVTSAPAYKNIPFYADILSGDENTYLLFLQLAAYFCTYGGVVCYIIPLNLFGDKSTQRAREIFANSHWSIMNLTRFYKRTVLFEGVLQGVCVVCFVKTPPAGDYDLHVKGGDNVSALSSLITVHKSQVIDSHLHSRRATWYKSWMVIHQPAAYDVWAHIRNVISTDIETIISGKLDSGQGDVNATYAKPLQSAAGQGNIPVTKGSELTDYGGWQAYSYLSTGVQAGNGNTERVRKVVERIAQLDHLEVAIFLKEVSGLEMRRPIRGTVVERSSSNPIVADHTLLSIRAANSNYNDMTYAVFALLTSALSNYIFGLFSTNAHVAIAEVLRTPTPAWTPEIEAALAALAREAMRAGLVLDNFAGNYRGAVTVSSVLAASGLPTMRLGDAVASQRLIITGNPSRKVQTLANNGQLAIRPPYDRNAEYVSMVTAILATEERPYSAAASGNNQLLLPDPSVATALQTAYNQANADIASYQAALETAVKAIDDAVYYWYGITDPTWRALIDRGMPWSV